MTDPKPAMTMREIREALGHKVPAVPEPDDEVRQLLVHPAVWPYLEAWLAARNIGLSRQQFGEDDLPTYVMTIRPAPCARCKGTAIDPEASAAEGIDGVAYLEPCSACQLATP